MEGGEPEQVSLEGVERGAGEEGSFPLPHEPGKLFLQELPVHQTRSGLFPCWMLVQICGRAVGSRGACSSPASR